jgi:hypothetical protein
LDDSSNAGTPFSSSSTPPVPPAHQSPSARVRAQMRWQRHTEPPAPDHQHRAALRAIAQHLRPSSPAPATAPPRPTPARRHRLTPPARTIHHRAG